MAWWQSKQTWQKWMAVAMMTVVLGACGDQKTANSPEQGTDSAAADKELRIGYIGPSKTAGGAVGWALHQGSLQQAVQPIGFGEVKEYVFANGPDLSEALLGGKLDVGIFGDTPALTAQANRGGTTLIGFNAVGHDSWLMGREGFKQLSDLQGKNVGVPKGSYMHRYVSGLIAAGLLKDVNVKFLLPRDAQSALSKGDIDAFAAPIQLGPQLQSLGYNTIDLASQHQLQGNSVIVVGNEFLQQNPQFFKVFDEVRRQAVKELRANPDAYYQYYLKYTEYKEPIIRASFPIDTYLEDTYPEAGLKLLAGTKGFLLNQKIIGQDVDVEQWKLRS